MFINDKVFDSGLTVLDTDVETLYINSLEPATFTAASSTNKLGTKAAPAVGAPENGAVDGRRVIVAAITDGAIDATGTATHYSLTDDSLSLLLVTGSLTASQAVTAGNPFSLDAISVTIRDAA
jgi:hypothetical protein